MKYLATLLLILGFGLSGSLGQTIKTLGYNTTNGQVVASITGFDLEFTNSAVAFRTLAPDNIQFPSTADAIIYYDGNDYLQFRSGDILAYKTIAFTNSAAATTRANLGFSTNLNTLWEATNASNARSAIGLGETNSPTFNTVTAGTNGIVVGTAAARFSQSASGGGAAIGWQGSGQRITFIGSIGMTLEDAGLGIAFGASNTNGAAISRTNLGLGATWLTNTNAASFRAGIGVRDVIWKFKETNQTNNSGALTNDTVLSFTAAANTKYFVTLTLMFPSVSGQLGVSGKIAATNGATVYGAHYSYDDGLGLTTDTFGQQSGTAITDVSWIYQAADSVSTIGFVQVPFVVATGTNSTAVTFQFTKALSYTNAIIGAGSTLKAEIIE